MDSDRLTSFLEYNGRALTLHSCSLFYKLKIDAGPKSAAFCAPWETCVNQPQQDNSAFFSNASCIAQKPVKRQRVCSVLSPCSQGIITTSCFACSGASGYRCRRLKKLNIAISVSGAWVAELDKRSFYGNAVAVQIAACQTQSCIRAASWVAVPGRQHPGDSPPSFPATGYGLTQPGLKKFGELFVFFFFSQGSNLCLAWGSTGHFPLSPPPPKHLVESETTGWFSGVKPVSWRASAAGSCSRRLCLVLTAKLHISLLIPNNLGKTAGCVHWGNNELVLSPWGAC